MTVDVGAYVDQYFGNDSTNPTLKLVVVEPQNGDNDAVETEYLVRGWAEDFGSNLRVAGLVPAGTSKYCVTGDSLREHGVEPQARHFLLVDDVRYVVESVYTDALKAVYVLTVSGPVTGG